MSVGILKIDGTTKPNGAREDLSNLIRTADVAETPFFAMVKKTAGPKNVLFQWQMDKYNPVDRDSVADGYDVNLSGTTFSAIETRALAKNYVHVSQRETRVGFYTEDIQEVAGVPSEFDRSMARRTFELRRDMESVLCSNQNGNFASNTSKTKALGSFICENGFADITIDGTADGGANTDNPKDAATDVADGFRATAGATAANTIQTSATTNEAQIQNLMEAVYANTGKKGNFAGIVGVTLRGKFTQMAGTHVTADTSLNREQADNKLISTVSIFEGDFGNITLFPSTFVDNDLSVSGTKGKLHGYFLNMDGIELKYHTPPTAQSLPQNGGGPAGLVRSIYGLCVYNPLEHGRIRTVTL